MCARKKASTSCRASALYLAIMVMFKDMKIQVMIQKNKNYIFECPLSTLVFVEPTNQCYEFNNVEVFLVVSSDQITVRCRFNITKMKFNTNTFMNVFKATSYTAAISSCFLEFPSLQGKMVYFTKYLIVRI